MSNEKESKYCVLDHANKRTDRLRVNPNRASVRQALQRQATRPTTPTGVADFDGESTDKADRSK